MNKLLKSIVALPLLVLLLCAPTLMTACDKAPSPPPLVKQSLAPPAIVVDPVLLEAHRDAVWGVSPAVESVPSVSSVSVAPPAESVRSTQHFQPNPDAESRAYSKAFRNAARATCLRLLLDTKVAYDQRVGRITDIGNVRDLPVCGR